MKLIQETLRVDVSSKTYFFGEDIKNQKDVNLFLYQRDTKLFLAYNRQLRPFGIVKVNKPIITQVINVRVILGT